ncbi:MAG: polysaccharide lyase [Thermoleophilia bacterium]
MRWLGPPSWLRQGGIAVGLLALGLLLGACSGVADRVADSVRATPPTFSDGDILWRGGFEAALDRQWTDVHVQADDRIALVADPVRLGKRSARFEVRPGDTVNPKWGGELAQVLQTTEEQAGQESWWAWSVLFPEDFPTTSGWCVFAEWHQTGLPNVPQGPAPINFDCSDDGYRLIVRGGDEPDWEQRVFPLPQLERGQWHDFLFHVRWSPDPDGFVQLWIDGEEVIPRTSLRTSYRDQGLYLKAGLYRDASPDTAVLYLDGFRRYAAPPPPGSLGSPDAETLPGAPTPAPAPAESGAAAPEPFEAAVVDAGCSACVVAATDDGIEARIAGGGDEVDTAYGVVRLNGEQGWPGRVRFAATLRLPAGQALSAPLSVLQLRDTADRGMVDVYLDASRVIRVWSPAGGLASESIDVSTDVELPADGGEGVRLEVVAGKDDALVVLVDDVPRVREQGLSGASPGNAGTLRAGIDHYDADAEQDPVGIRIEDVEVGRADDG